MLLLLLNQKEKRGGTTAPRPAGQHKRSSFAAGRITTSTPGDSPTLAAACVNPKSLRNSPVILDEEQRCHTLRRPQQPRIGRLGHDAGG